MTRVMIVDDELEMSRLLKMLLEMEGFTVATSPTGKGALEKAALEAPDVFMVDYHLHDMSGEDLIRKLRADPALASVPIVVASGRDVEPEVKRAGATDFMLKPFEPDALIETLKRLAADAAVSAAPAQVEAAPAAEVKTEPQPTAPAEAASVSEVPPAPSPEQPISDLTAPAPSGMAAPTEPLVPPPPSTSKG